MIGWGGQNNNVMFVIIFLKKWQIVVYAIQINLPCLFFGTVHLQKYFVNLFEFSVQLSVSIPVGGANAWLTAYCQTISMGTAERPRRLERLAAKVVVFNLDTDSLNTNLTQECARGQLWKVGLVWRHFTNIIFDKKKKWLSWSTKEIDWLMTLLVLNKSLIKYLIIISNN